MELEESIKIAVEGCDVDLYDIQQTKENKTNILRVYISHKDGVNLDKCAEVSRMVSPLLDIDEPMNGKYNLEVSSPGVERKLKSIHQFECSIGCNVKVKEFSTDVTKGKLVNVSNEVITIKDSKGETSEINYSDVLSASTYFVWNK